MRASSPPGPSGGRTRSNPTTSAKGRRRDAAGSPIRSRVRGAVPSWPARRRFSQSPMSSSPWRGEAPTRPCPRVLPAGQSDPAGTYIGAGPGAYASKAKFRAAPAINLGEPSTPAGSTRRGPLGRRAAIPDGPLGGAGPRPGLGASRPQWPIGLVRCRGAGTTGASERRPRRDRKVPRPAISPGPPRQSPDGRRGWVSRHPHGAGVILTSFPYCTVTLGDGAVAFVDLAILLERPVSRDGSSRLDS